MCISRYCYVTFGANIVQCAVFSFLYDTALAAYNANDAAAVCYAMRYTNTDYSVVGFYVHSNYKSPRRNFACFH
jgi:hypothetical protein